MKVDDATAITGTDITPIIVGVVVGVVALLIVVIVVVFFVMRSKNAEAENNKGEECINSPTAEEFDQTAEKAKSLKVEPEGEGTVALAAEDDVPT